MNCAAGKECKQLMRKKPQPPWMDEPETTDKPNRIIALD
jgi:hypothetical protein